jgi:hypothetical protein
MIRMMLMMIILIRRVLKATIKVGIVHLIDRYRRFVSIEGEIFHRGMT